MSGEDTSERRKRLIERAMKRAEELMEEQASCAKDGTFNVDPNRLHADYYTNVSNKGIEAWLKSVEGESDEDSSTSDGDKGVRAPHSPTAGKKKKDKSNNEATQASQQSAENAAMAAATPRHGIEVNREVLRTEKKDPSDWFLLTEAQRKRLNQPASVTHIKFLQGAEKMKDFPIEAGTTLAVRLNENYEDAHAIVQGERSYVRPYTLRAQDIVVMKTGGKHPIMFMTGFATDQITDGTKRACDAAADRIVFAENKKLPKIDVNSTIPQDRLDYRIIGPIDEMNKIIDELCTDEWMKQMRSHHVNNVGVLHAYLTPQDLRKVREKKVSVELKQNIVSSVNKARMLTIRKTDATADQMFELAQKLQTGKVIPAVSASATSCFRTHGTLRVTLDVEVTSAVLKALRENLTGFRLFTDVPVNVWASAPGDGNAGTINVPRAPRPRPAHKPLSNDRRLVRISADYEPHPSAFAKIAEFFKGSVHNIRDPRFTDRPMDALISVPKDADYSTYIAEGFAIDEGGSWTMEPVGAAFGAGPV
jgi:hypothetical protein